jgi:hypothetical protein
MCTHNVSGFPESPLPLECLLSIDYVPPTTYSDAALQALKHKVAARDALVAGRRKKSYRHNGQDKLLVVETRFLKLYAPKGSSVGVLYVGAACGKHIVRLANEFPHVDFLLYDTVKFNSGLYRLDNVKIEHRFYEGVGDTSVGEAFDKYYDVELFIDDHMSLSKGAPAGNYAQDLQDSLRWFSSSGASYGMIKFNPIYYGGWSVEMPLLDLWTQPCMEKVSACELRAVLGAGHATRSVDYGEIDDLCQGFRENRFLFQHKGDCLDCAYYHHIMGRYDA